MNPGDGGDGGEGAFQIAFIFGVYLFIPISCGLVLHSNFVNELYRL
jgi:hypothetical protein